MTKMRKSVTDLYKKVIVYCLMTVKMTVDLLSCRQKGENRKAERNLHNKREDGKMKTKFRHRVIAMTLAMMMTAAPVWGAAHATDEAISVPEAPAAEVVVESEPAPAPVQEAPKAAETPAPAPKAPEAPAAESHKDNAKIEEYNKKVDEYNESAKAHNEAVDKEYEAAVAETEQKNAEIERVKAAEERNAQAVRDAEEANAKIDEENAAEEARVNEHNSSEDEKAKASAEARKAAEDWNEASKAHNEAVAKYAEDKAKYDADYAQYQKDLAMEQKIKAAGYASVEQYNDMINTHYNEPARASVEKNASANIVSAKDTYSVEEAAVKSGEKVKVRIAHIFEGTDVSYVDEFEIDRNDVITINSIAALGNATAPGYASLYYSTDDAHTMGYWVPWDELQYNARYVNSSWNCGTSYEISYRDGKNHKYDEEVIYMTYNYTWEPQKVYKTYNTPVAPEELTDPGEARELVEVPELYTPEYQEFVKKQHVEAEIEDIEAANILEHIMDPVKGAYIALLSYMDLFDAPAAAPAEVQTAVVIPAAEIAAEKAKTAKAAAPAARATAKAAEAAPAAAEIIEAEAAKTAMIAEKDVPMAGVAAESSFWALLNLIMAVLTGIMSAVLLVGYFGREENDEENEDESTDRKGFARFMSIIPAAAALILFVLTENMRNPMVLTDRWTILMAVILMIQAVVAYIDKKSEDDNDDDEIAEAANA